MSREALILIAKTALLLFAVSCKLIFPNLEWLFIGTMILSVQVLDFYQLGIVIGLLLTYFFFRGSYLSILIAEVFLVISLLLKWLAFKNHNMKLKLAIGSTFLAEFASGKKKYSSYDFYFFVWSLAFLFMYLQLV